MVIYYKLDTKEFVRSEDNTQTPIMPFNMTDEQRREYYLNQGIGFVGIPQELYGMIVDFNLIFDEQGNFTGLQPK